MRSIKTPFFNVFFVLFLLSLCLTSCQYKQTLHQTDLGNLYAIKRTPEEKDSLFKTYEADIIKIQQLTNTVKHQDYIDSILNYLRYTSSPKAFFALTDIAIRDAKKKHDQNRLAQLYEKTAVFYHDNQQLDSVYHYYLKAEQLYKRINDSLALAENSYYQARLLYEVGLDKESEVKLYQALKLFPNNLNTPILIEANQLKAFYLNHYSEHEAALKILLETYQSLQEDEGTYSVLPYDTYNIAMANLLGNIGMNYHDSGQYEEAEKYALLGLAYYAKSPHYIQVYAHLNRTYYLALYEQKKDNKTIERLMESYRIYSELKHYFYAIDISMIISTVYLEQGQKELALDWLENAYDLSEKNKFYSYKREIIEKILTDHSDAHTSHLVQELITVNHFLEGVQKKTLESFAKIEYNTLKLEQENATLKQRIYFVYLGAFIVIGALIFLLVFIRLRNKNKDLEHSNMEKSKNEQIMNLLIENNTLENETILKERNRIAKDLHDGIINSIFTLRFNTQLLQIADHTFKGMLVDELVQLENKVRDISHAFSQQSIFQNKSFEHLVEELVQKQSNKNKTKFSLAYASTICLEHLSTMQKVNIYQIIQEAFQNVNKHAHAAQCQLKITMEDDTIVLRIEDNGKGFKNSAHRGIGLENMKERAQLIGAQLQIKSEIGKGTTVLLYLSNL
ncbi:MULTISPECIES: ATP-binding protein [unclassified Myroides]|uniref:sensor histidine kinase n=1 Tax=unclassified Myroides TaxID=2642485 RepID=UPI003D2F836B